MSSQPLNQGDALLFHQLHRFKIKLELRRKDSPARLQAAVAQVKDGFHDALIEKRDAHLFLDDHVNRFCLDEIYGWDATKVTFAMPLAFAVALA